MVNINMTEVERKIGYWQHNLSKLDREMLKIQSKRVDIKQRLEHLNNLRN
jgi:prefoldin subunit 5